MSTKNNQISSNDHQIKKSADLFGPCLFTFLLLIEVVHYLINPSNPTYQFPLPFYALMACVWSWFHWDLNRDYEKTVDLCDRALTLAERMRSEKINNGSGNEQS